MGEALDMYAVELSKWNRLKEIEKEEASLLLQQTNIIERLSQIHKERNEIFGTYITMSSPSVARQTSQQSEVNDAEKTKAKELKRQDKAEKDKKRQEEEEERKKQFEQQTKAKYEADLKAHQEAHSQAQEVLKKQKDERKAKKLTDKQAKKEQKAADKAKAKLQKKNTKSAQTTKKEETNSTTNINSNNNESNVSQVSTAPIANPAPKPVVAATTTTTSTNTNASNSTNSSSISSSAPTSNSESKPQQEHQPSSRSIKARSMIFSGPLHLTDANTQNLDNPKRSVIASEATGDEPLCPQCNKPVLRQQANVKALNQQYHRACFKCSVPLCQKFISTITAVEVEGKPYCKEHADEIKKSATATKPLELPTKEPTTNNVATTNQTNVNSNSSSSHSDSVVSPEPEVHMIEISKPETPTTADSTNKEENSGVNNSNETQTGTGSNAAESNNEADNKPSSMVRKLFNKRREAAAAAGNNSNNTAHVSPDEGNRAAFVSSVDSVHRTKSVIVRGTSAAAARFASSQEKCDVCGKTVYVVDKIAADGKVFHKPCLRCQQCDKVLKLGNYASLEGKFYCKPHFKQLFMEKGNYSEGFGGKKLTQEWADQHGKEVTAVII